VSVPAELADAVARATGATVTAAQPTSGGSINEAWALELDDGRRAFVKTRADAAPGEFATEAAGLRWLADAHAVQLPEVLAVGEEEPRFLALEWIEEGSLDRAGEEALGRGLAALHAAGAPANGAPPPGAPAPASASTRVTRDVSGDSGGRLSAILVRRGQPTSRSSRFRSATSSRRRAAYSKRRSAAASRISSSSVRMRRESSSRGSSARSLRTRSRRRERRSRPGAGALPSPSGRMAARMSVTALRMVWGSIPRSAL
jgi:hypothetical protein